jgi:small subunit ribosomal protein S20
MASHVSAAKRARQRIKRTARNRLLLGSLRSNLKRARTALSAGNAGDARSVVAEAARAAAHAASKGVIHKNAAARLSSRLHKALNKLGISA